MNSNDNPLVANQVGDFDSPENYEDFTEIFEREYKKAIDAINSKEGGLYLPQELSTFQKYYDPENPLETRNVYRKLIIFGELPNNSSKRVQHNITFTNVTRVTRVYGAANDPSGLNFIPLPFSSTTLADNVMVELDETDVIVTTGSDRSNFEFSTIVIEYIKG